MALKRDDGTIVAEEPLAPPGGSWGGPTIDPTTVRFLNLDIPWNIADSIKFSVGSRSIWSQPSIEPRLVIPTLAQPIIIDATAALPGQGDRRDGAPLQEELQIMQGVDTNSPFYMPGVTQAGIDYMARKAAAQLLPDGLVRS